MSDMADALKEMVQQTLGLLQKVQEMENWGDESLWDRCVSVNPCNKPSDICWSICAIMAEYWCIGEY